MPTLGDVIIASFQQVWGGVVAFVPVLIVAIIIFLIGLIIATALGKIVEQIIRTLKIDKALESLGVEEFVNKAGLKLDSGAFLGGLVRWFFIVVFLLAAIDMLGLEQVNIFLNEVLIYLPQVIAAILLLLAAALIAGVMQRVVISSAKAANLDSAGLLGGVTKWSIWIFAILAAIYQLGIAGGLIQTLFTGFVAMLAIAGGLSFGLGGKEAASRYIEKLKADITHKS